MPQTRRTQSDVGREGQLRSRLTFSMSNIQVRALKLLVACTSILRSGFEAESPDDQE
jgi:hypothetical protein